MLTGKNIVVLGATGNIGSRLCTGLINLGANVVGVSRTKQDIDFSNREREHYLPIMASMLDDNELKRVISEADNYFGTLNGWVNSANSSIPTSKLEYERDQLNSEFQNLISLMMATKFISEYFESKSVAGSIVNIASIYGTLSPVPAVYEGTSQIQNPVGYGISKAGLIQFSRFSAVNLANLNIRVNSLILGPFPSENVQNDEKFINNLKSRLPLGRVGQPEEIVGAVSYLLSDFSSFTTGAQIVVDGGWSAI